MPRNSTETPHLFFNRHLSWMQFNRRVLEEALDAHNPLLERVKFLAITASNLDEFVEVRVAGLLQQAEQGQGEAGPDGLAPREVLTQLSAAIHDFVKDQYDCWREKLLPAMSEESIRVRSLPPAEAGSAKSGRALLSRSRRAADDAGHGGSRTSLSARDEQSAVHGIPAATEARRFAGLSRCGHRSARAVPALSRSFSGRYLRIHFSPRHCRSLCRAPVSRLQDSRRRRLFA